MRKDLPLSPELQPVAFVDDRTFLTRSGSVGTVYRLAGVDFEGQDDEERRLSVASLEAAFKQVDETVRVYQHLIKRRSDDLFGRRLYTIDLYLTLLVEGRVRITRANYKELFLQSGPRILNVREDELTRAVLSLRRQSDAFVSHLSAAKPTPLDAVGTVTFLRRLVNDNPWKIDHAAADFLDQQMVESDVECHPDHLVIGSVPVRILTMKEAPRSTVGLMLEALYSLPGDVIACLEWRRWTVEQAQRYIISRTRYFSSKQMIVTPASLRTGPVTHQARPAGIVNQSAVASMTQLGEVLTKAMNDGHILGDCALTLMLSGDNVDACVTHARNALAGHEGVFFPEGIKQVEAWLAIVPGNTIGSRKLALLETNAADLGFLFGIDQGQVVGAAGRQPVATLVTRHDTPYRLHLHDAAGVGHAAVLGHTGSGKSTLLKVLADGSTRHGRVAIFDVGRDYRALADHHGGRVLPFGLDTAINPFSLHPSPEHLSFLLQFCSLLITRDGYVLTEADTAALYAAITRCYLQPAHLRRLGIMARLGLPLHLTRRLAPWISGGRYGQVFDVVTDHVTTSDFQVYEFEAIAKHPDLLDPVLFYVLYRLSERFSPDTPTLCVLDEAWQFVTHPIMRAFVLSAFKTWRKRNASIIIATQSVEDLVGPDAFLRAVLESCHTTLFLANPDLDRNAYASRAGFFHFNERELDLLTNLTPRRHVLLRRSGAERVTKCLTLVLDPDAPWLTDSGQDYPQKETLYA